MAIDGITIRALVQEFNENLIGGRIQKIYQINNHVILLNIYNNKNNYKLLISSNPQNPRIHFTKGEYDNPSNPPQFCMILRKHIQNSFIRSISQIGMDRTIEIVLRGKDELGFNQDKKLIVDIIGKYSNIVLTDSNNKVIEANKRISHEMSSVRAVYPGTKFDYLRDDKINILENHPNLDSLDIADNEKLRKIFYMNFTGFGPQISNEIIFNAELDINATWGILSQYEKNRLQEEFNKIVKLVIDKKFNPTIFLEHEKFVDYYPLSFNSKSRNFEYLNSISDCLDRYFLENINDNSLNQSKDNLKTQVLSIISKSISKLDNLKLDYDKSLDFEKYRIEGDLLSTVAHTIKKGDKKVNVNNFYTNTIDTIELNEKKSAWENIEEKYKISKKFQRSLDLLNENIPALEDNIEYLKSIKVQIDNIDSHIELEELRDELQNLGFIKKSSKKKIKQDEISKPLHMTTPSGNSVYIGKNNKQNEYLTLRLANPDDIFFHIKDLPGSHVILRNSSEINDDDIEFAAKLAAKYSKNQGDKYVDVDYTQKKNVNKAKGAKPGMVYYSNYKTIRINLEENI